MIISTAWPWSKEPEATWVCDNNTSGSSVWCIPRSHVLVSLSLSRTFVVKGYNFENIFLLLQHYRKKKHDRHGIFPPKSVTPQRALSFFDWKFVFMQETNVICDNSLIFPFFFVLGKQNCWAKHGLMGCKRALMKMVGSKHFPKGLA